jgi:hypothetical protein
MKGTTAKPLIFFSSCWTCAFSLWSSPNLSFAVKSNIYRPRVTSKTAPQKEQIGPPMVCWESALLLQSFKGHVMKNPPPTLLLMSCLYKIALWITYVNNMTCFFLIGWRVAFKEWQIVPLKEIVRAATKTVGAGLDQLNFF